MIRVFIVLFLISSTSAMAADNIFIDSLFLDMDLQSNIATYRQEVVVNSGANRLECDKMDVYFENDDKKQINESYSVNKILFFDNIILNNGLKVINANRAEYLAVKRVIYFWDKVSVKDGENYLSADKIIYDLNKDLVTVLNESKGKSEDGSRVRIILEDQER